MKKRIRILLLLLTVTMVLGTTIITSANASSTNENIPHYKLKENVRRMFRPEWVWSEEKQDYTNLDALVRDPETDLFPQPEPFPEALEGYAYWDGYVGLFIINSVKINHETGEVIENPLEGTISVRADWPEYKFSSEDPFDQKYLEYKEFVNEKYVEGSSIVFPELYIIQEEGFTQDWFGVSASDLPMLLAKLEEGAPTSYTMSMILLVTNTDVGFLPSDGASYRFSEWVNLFNKLTRNAETMVDEGKYKELGYLALPIINKQLKSKNDEMLKYLPEIASGLYTNDRDSVKSWGSNEWLNWFVENEEIVEALQYILNHEVNMKWLD